MKYSQYRSRSDFLYGAVVAAMFIVSAVGVGASVFGGSEQAMLQTMQARMELPARTQVTQVASERTGARS